jgi:hypothetical protein
MGWISGIASALMAIIKALPILDRWFTKTPTQKIESELEKLRKDLEEAKKSGRP